MLPTLTRGSRPLSRVRAASALFICLALLLTLVPMRTGSTLAGPLETGNLLLNGDFSSGMAPWWATDSINATIVAGELNAEIRNGGANPWDAIVGQNNLPIEAGETYTVTFDARASVDTSLVFKIQQEPAPYTTYFERSVSLTTESQSFQYVFTSGFSDAAAALQFQMGGHGALTIYIDNVVLEGKIATGPPVEVLIKNGSFSAGLPPWWTAGQVTSDLSGICLTIGSGANNLWDAIFGQGGVAVESGVPYTLEFDAYASQPATVGVRLQQDGPPYAAYFSQDVTLDSAWQTFSYNFTSATADPAASFQFQMGGNGTPTICLTNISLSGADGELLQNGDFMSGAGPWWSTPGISTDLGGVCLDIQSGGSNPWDVILGQGSVPVEAGATYVLSFEAYASQPVTISALLQEDGGSYTGYFAAAVALTTQLRSYEYTFASSGSDSAAAFQFQMGGLGTPRICINNVSLLRVATGVRVNQVGYLPGAPKRASVVHPATAPLSWQLRDADLSVVLSGTTELFGADVASGDHVHIVDFSEFRRPGAGFTLKVGEDISHPFDIGPQIYRSMRYDALAYFYHNRSGIAIEMPYAGDAKWTRPAGHIGVSPNQGDFGVTCFNGIDVEGQSWPGCSYDLDVHGGWYDAGDHGKYVVNGGISVWTLLNLYERTRHLGRPGALAYFADGRMNIPENANGVPDLLDEARWEMEFLLRMQIPATADADLAGMVHHKVHDANWTGLPTPPHQDAQMRYLYPPSTAATLNLAATAAQCARIWRTIDSQFAQRCEEAAESAWQAALAHPGEYARNNFTGGGPYDDTRLSDEFYWAASELYITTGESQYYDYLSASPHFSETPILEGSLTSMTWQATAALGSISLAVVPSQLSTGERAALRQRISGAADLYLAAIASEGYGTPFKPEDNGGYPWGSNSNVLNNAIILALAYDFTGDSAYRDGVSESMDYLLGRNAMDQSYVSGYGENPLLHPHHRFWADQKDPAFPPPPPGAISGGPNSALQDPYAGARLAGCKPQKCFIDHIDSWSTNEITINWNSPFAWVTAFLDEQKLSSQHLPLIRR